MSKNSLFVVALFLLLSLSYAARPEPKTQQEGFGSENLDANEVCEGVGEEECLMRRTLVAHTDYIYTQGNKNKP
ncbi:phytosulfokines 3-like [Tasmannia lanceolata]|uniref:phytosulfokines 3-like n=1 Tax=Tasmannia lanceolata TaxID=3420 RepID=UPI00406425C6